MTGRLSGAVSENGRNRISLHLGEARQGTVRLEFKVVLVREGSEVRSQDLHQRGADHRLGVSGLQNGEEEVGAHRQHGEDEVHRAMEL